jgi:hypothetical protein
MTWMIELRDIVEANVLLYRRTTGVEPPRTRQCSLAHVYATYLPRCPWCVPVLLPTTQGDGWMELDGA